MWLSHHRSGYPSEYEPISPCSMTLAQGSHSLFHGTITFGGLVPYMNVLRWFVDKIHRTLTRNSLMSGIWPAITPQ